MSALKRFSRFSAAARGARSRANVEMGSTNELFSNERGASGDEFRTAPLWGLGQRSFFLHDGRTSDLLEAIAAHESPDSEANGVVRNFNGLSESQKQDLSPSV